MMHPMWQALLLLVGATFIIWGLHALSWHLLHSLILVTDRLSGFRDSRVWARIRPLQAWLRLRHPQLHTIFAARLRTNSFSGLPLTLLIFSALYIAALLGGLTQEMMEAGTVLKLDLAINAFFTPWRERTLVRAFLWVTDLGSGPELTVVAMTATGFFWVDRRPGFILPLWIAFLGAQATTWSGKYLIERHRPEFIQAVIENSPSFPSGHATASMALYGPEPE